MACVRGRMPLRRVMPPVGETSQLMRVEHERV